MERINRTFLTIGVVFMTLGWLLPWVKFDSQVDRASRLNTLNEWLEKPLVQKLLETELKVAVPLDGEAIWRFWGQSEYAPVFYVLENKKHLFFWDFFVVPAHRMTQIVIGGVFFWYLVGAVLVIHSFLGGKFTGDALERNWEDYDEGQKSQVVRFYLPPWLVSIICFLFFSSQLPFLDSLGYSNNHSFLLMDALFHAQVTPYPRLLIPLGLLCFIFIDMGRWLAGRKPRNLYF